MYLEKYQLDGRVAVVTGGARAIGLACVEALAEAGARVVIADRDPAVAAEGQDEMKKKGHAVEVVEMDVTDSERVTVVAAQLTKRFGGVDILVNNAGIARSDTPAEDVADEHWLNVLDVNLNGVFWCCRAFGRADAGARQGLDRQCRLDVRFHRQPAAAPELLQRLQGGGASSDEIPGGGMGRARGAGQCRGADLYRYAP